MQSQTVAKLLRPMFILATVIALLAPAALAQSAPDLLITELIPNGKNVVAPATGAVYNEAFEMVELYNNTPNDLVLGDFKFTIRVNANLEEDWPWIEGSEKLVIPAYSVMLIWPKQADNPFSTDDFYAHFAAKNPDLKRELIAIVRSKGMSNSQERTIFINTVAGERVSGATYDGFPNETVDDRGIHYGYPTDSGAGMRKLRFGADSLSTPGLVDAEQVPSAGH